MKETVVNVNEAVKKEMEGIIWSAETEVKKESTPTEVKKEQVIAEVKDLKSDENVVNIEGEVKEDSNEIAGGIPAEDAETKKRNVLKFGNKKWAEALPETEQFNANTVFCFKPDEFGKIGKFKEYGKKERIIWLDMFKKDTLDTMSRAWAVRIEECDIVEHNGTLYNTEKYSKDEKGYHILTGPKASKIVPEAVKPAEEIIKPTEEIIKDEVAAETETV